MTRDAQVIGEAIEQQAPEIGRFLDECKAKFVPEQRAKEHRVIGPDDSYFTPSVPETDSLRRKLVATLKLLGKHQTGRDVSLGWCSTSAKLIAENATGECDFDLHQCDIPGVLQTVVEAARKQLECELKEANPDDPEIPF